MTENQHLAPFLKHLRARIGSKGKVFKHQDARTTGVPDVSLTLGGRTSWLEAKKTRRGRIIGTGLQHQTMRELAVAGKAWYLVWDDERHEPVCHVVQPKDIQLNGTFLALYSETQTAMLVELLLDLHLGIAS